jgi:hypothetical protein
VRDCSRHSRQTALISRVIENPGKRGFSPLQRNVY